MVDVDGSSSPILDGLTVQLPSRLLASSEGWRPPGAQSTFIKLLFRECCSHCIDSSHMTASSSLRGVDSVHLQILRVDNVVYDLESDWARPHLCKLARHVPWPVWKRFIRDHV